MRGDDHERILDNGDFELEIDGEWTKMGNGDIQGAVKTTVNGFADTHGLYIRGIVATGAGTELMQSVVHESIQKGYGGKFHLDSIDGAHEYYERMGGVAGEYNIYSWDEQAAQALLSK